MRNQRDCYERHRVASSSPADQIEPADPQQIRRSLELWEASSKKPEAAVNNFRSRSYWLTNPIIQLYRFVQKVLTNKHEL